VNFFINGYFGFGNAGDEAVLAAMLAHLRVLDSHATFTATSGNPKQTEELHNCSATSRQNPRELLSAISKCDVFLSGGGSLVQDVTSVRNALYYTTMLRTARMLGKPTMVYAQGVGPLRSQTARVAARAAFQGARIVTVRDGDSAGLLRVIGVTRAVEITADPVWDLSNAESGSRKSEKGNAGQEWVVALRSWPGEEGGAAGRIIRAVRELAREAGATVRFLAMQPGVDDVLLGSLVAPEEWMETKGKHPREIIDAVSGASLVLAMRLHALIFAASLGVPVVAFDYDPKVRALANIIGAPLVASPSEADLKELPAKINQAKALDSGALELLKAKARRNAELAARMK